MIPLNTVLIWFQWALKLEELSTRSYGVWYYRALLTDAWTEGTSPDRTHVMQLPGRILICSNPDRGALLVAYPRGYGYDVLFFMRGYTTGMFRIEIRQ